MAGKIKRKNEELGSENNISLQIRSHLRFAYLCLLDMIRVWASTLRILLNYRNIGDQMLPEWAVHTVLAVAVQKDYTLRTERSWM